MGQLPRDTIAITAVKVLFVIDTLEIGGAERSLLEIASRLKNFSPIVCSLFTGTTLRSAFEERRVPVHAFDIQGKYAFIEGYRKLKQLVEEEKPALIVSALYRAEMISRLVSRATGVPQLSSIVSDTYSAEKRATMSWRGRVLFTFFYWINRLTAGIPYAFVANSKSIGSSVGKALGISGEKIHVIYRGRKIPSGKPNRPKDRQKFLCVGRLITSKGHDLILEAFASIHAEFPSATLSFAGDGPDRVRLENLALGLAVKDHVFFLGQCESMDEVYAGHDCLVFASRLEGFSGVLVEAMMAGIPILASDIVMNKEAIDSGRTGYLFMAGDVSAIRTAMEYFLKHREEAARLSEVGFQDAVARFNIESIAQQHERLYLQIINKWKA